MIRDLVASVLLVGGSLLALLGAVGLLRFPDVFTRMHAATKAATVGVIVVTGAAAVEAGTVGGALLLVLIVALLFLSGPLGVSLLARAAYHDPETPMAPQTRQVSWEPSPQPGPSRRVSGLSPVLPVWLLFVWVTAFGGASAGIVVGGSVAAIAVTWLLRSLAPRWPGALMHPIAALRFAIYFLGQMASGTWDVLVNLFRRSENLRPAVVEMPLRVKTRNEVTLLANSVSFTPGTIALELDGPRLFIHALHTDSADEIVAEIKSMEDHVINAFGRNPDRSTNAPNITYRRT